MAEVKIQEFRAGAVCNERFQNEIVPAAQPVVFRNLLDDRPVVRAAHDGSQALRSYFRRFDIGNFVKVKVAPPEAKGRLFYDDDLAGFNFRKRTTRIDAALDTLLAMAKDERPSAFAIQSISTRAHLPGFDRDNPMPLLPDTVEPRLWMGNAIIVAAHYDASENIACAVAGRRRFTLFPPEKVCDLYPGPFELTPNGPPVSMVDFDAPDHERYPRFANALAAASVVDLTPGDAIYIPYLWWHHVRSIDAISLLVNYWWKPTTATYGNPIDAMRLSMMAIKNLPDPHRAAWRAMFDQYVFMENGPPGTHLPVASRGVLGELTDEESQRLGNAMTRSFANPPKGRARRLAPWLRRAALAQWRRR